MISPPHIIMIILLEQGMPELIFYGSTSFVDLLCFFCLAFAMPLFVPYGHLLGHG